MDYWKLRWAMERRDRVIEAAQAAFNAVMREEGLDPAKNYAFNDADKTCVEQQAHEPKAP